MKIIKGIIIGCMALTLSACASNNDKDSTKQVTLDEAKTIALKHANVEENEIQFKETSAETKEGTFQYEIEFKDNNGKEYDYRINGNSGAIIKFDHSFADTSQSTVAGNNITLQQAKEKALSHANVKETDVTFTQTKEDTDNGIKVFDIEFNDKDKSYDYEINMQTGDITSYQIKKKTKTSNGKTVTLDQAKSIALKDAKITDTNQSFITAKEEVDDGITIYKLKFQNANKTYEYEIEKATGDILSFEVD